QHTGTGRALVAIRRGWEAPIPGSDSTAQFDAQLGQRASERRGDRSVLFVRKRLAKTRFRALSRFFGLRFVDAVSRNREVRQDGDAAGGDFDESLAGRHE